MAKKSWEKAFDSIVYLSWPPDPELASDNTVFHECDDFPRIKTLFEFCSVQRDMCAIVNADIVVLERFRQVEKKMESQLVESAVSKRFEFNPEVGLYPAKVVDFGLDIFVANPAVWKAALIEVPEQFRLGHILWDTWTLSFLYHRSKCVDFTPSKTIFHPKHENRIRPYQLECRMEGDNYLHRARFPTNVLS